MKQETKEILERLMKEVSAIKIPVGFRCRRASGVAGEHTSNIRGPSGDDIVNIRDYEPGDSVSKIDWPGSAKTGMRRIYTREFFEERPVNFVMVVDVSVTMGFGTEQSLKQQLAAKLCGFLVQSARKTHDRAGLVTYDNDGVVQMIKPGPAKVKLFPVMGAVLEPEKGKGPNAQFKKQETSSRWFGKKPIQPAKFAESAGKGETAKEDSTRFTSGLANALHVLPRVPSLVFVISDFLSMTEPDANALKRTVSKHDVFCMIIKDLREKQLHKSRVLIKLSDMRTGKTRTFFNTARKRRKFQANVIAHAKLLEDFLAGSQIGHQVFSCEDTNKTITKEMMQLFGRHHYRSRK